MTCALLSETGNTALGLVLVSSVRGSPARSQNRFALSACAGAQPCKGTCSSIQVNRCVSTHGGMRIITMIPVGPCLPQRTIIALQIALISQCHIPTSGKPLAFRATIVSQSLRYASRPAS